MQVETPHGTLRLPAFFPDGTQGVVRCVDAGDLRQSQVPGLVMNTYHLLSKPGPATLKAMGGLHRFIGWDRPILTDSGGFQVFSMIRENPKYGEIRPNEIVFRPDGGREKLLLSPEKCIQAQLAYGADILMCLDYCTHPDDPYEENLRSVETTVRWAKRCKEEYLAAMGRRKGEGKRPLLFAIIQGGGDETLRRQCACALKEIGFDGYGFGGWPLDDQNHLVEGILRLTAELMPDETPKYAMGLGMPEDIVACHEMGYNLFDCVVPTREAWHNRLYVFHSPVWTKEDWKKGSFCKRYYILDDSHRREEGPVSEDCDCYLCKNYSRAYLRHLYSVGDSLAYRLATIHNLRFYTMLLERLAGEDAHGR